ncbi:MAG: CBS domain-containing protein [Nitrospina sp.]|jgi:acetoin utilization protein AcuB|nr:CBS domain-containing protein [Nitrospina sp.]MBT3415216.1 CBS domain-containing protein [Nitrospina sp.]MBT3857425.1 CBS domain-containing protein [Nitrospina sp.]MBT4104052.1 CBS domain-containing protein [Nitrospina sp.]MBT4389792.1 CBS domain-containing protein [Nitrospina sp.]
MIVDEIMTRKVITVKPGDTLHKAQSLMVKNSIRHLPVLQKNKLEGIITESDIRGAFVNNTTISSRVPVLDPKQMLVKGFMTCNPQTVEPDANIEDAALLIYKNKIASLPVVHNDKLVGIISILDMLGLFIDLMGIIHSSSRVDVIMDKDPKNFEAVSKIIHDQGLNIISVGMSSYAKNKKKQVYFFRLDLCETATLVKQIEKAGFKVLSAID